MKKVWLIVVAVALLTSCSNDDSAVMNDPAEGSALETKSAADRIFTAKKIAENIQHSCTDLNGNFYYVYDNDIVKKYNLQTNVTEIIFRLPNEGDQSVSIGQICVDAQQNLYYRCYGGGEPNFRNVYKASFTEGSITEISNRLPVLNGISGADIEYLFCAAENGNVFIHVAVPDYNYNRVLYKLTPNGDATEITNAELLFGANHLFFGASHIHKMKGSYIFMSVYCNYSGYSNKYFKINTNTGAVEAEFPKTEGDVYLSATEGRDNPYILKGYDIYRLRPGNTDLHIGTIPSYVKDEDGKFVPVVKPQELHMDKNADVFYVVSYDACYKLTLD